MFELLNEFFVCCFTVFLTSQLTAARKANVALWLGLQHGSSKKSSFFNHAQSYVWISNEDVGYTNWNHGEPNGRNKVGLSLNTVPEWMYT